MKAIFTIASTVETFDRSAFKKAVALRFSVDADDIALTVQSASIVVTVSIAVDSESVAQDIATALETVAVEELELGYDIESISGIEVVTVEETSDSTFFLLLLLLLLCLACLQICRKARRSPVANVREIRIEMNNLPRRRSA